MQRVMFERSCNQQYYVYMRMLRMLILDMACASFYIIICVVSKWRRSNEKNEKATSLVIISYCEAVVPSEVRSLLGVPL